MRITAQVRDLPEVGHSVVTEAERLDAIQARLDAQQSALDADRMKFIQSLREHWTTDELTLAGIFGQ